MNENIDLTKILKNCPEGTKFYTTVWGEVSFMRILENSKIYAFKIVTPTGSLPITKEGCYLCKEYDTECIIFPSKDQRDWSKFTAPWYKKDKFDPKTLNEFDRVLGRDCNNHTWKCDFFSHINEQDYFPYKCIGKTYKYCIPYNDDTKHLLGTTDEAPEYYRYWEN